MSARGHWQARPALAQLLRIAGTVAPVVASAGASIALAVVTPNPEPGWQLVAWWLVVIGGGLAALIVVRSVTVRLLPLAALFDLTLAFPKQAPSRFKLARRIRSAEEALDVLQDMEQGASVQAAAEAALALVTALEVHDPGTRGHSERVRILADLIGEELGLAEADRIRLRWAALVHDLGKLHVHEDILNKPGRPSASEWEALQRHPLEGDRLVRPLRPWLGRWADAVLEHHERYDGDGYPHGRAGEDLSLAGRIVAVADAYETMTARRAYKEPRTAEDARRELVACSGSQFDPAIVRTFLAVSVPRTTRVAASLGALMALPFLAALQRLPTAATSATAAAGMSALAIVASGLAPGPGPDPAPSLASPERVEEPAAAPIAPSSDNDGSPRTGGARPPSATRAPGPSAPEPVDGTEPATTTRPATSPERNDTGPPADEPGRADAGNAAPATADHVLAEALYLGGHHAPGTDWRAVLPLTVTAPEADAAVPNHDRDRNDDPGLTLRRGDPRPSSAVRGVPAWTTRTSSATVVGGDLTVVLHTASPGFAHGLPGRLVIDLLDCATDLSDCQPIATARHDRADWSRGAARWSRVDASLGVVAHVLPADRMLTLTLTAAAPGTDLLVAFDTTRTPSRLVGLTTAPANAATLALEGSELPVVVRTAGPHMP